MFNNIKLPSEFLSIWINNNLLEKNEQIIFDTYYHGYVKSFKKRMQYYYDKQLESTIEILSKINNPDVLEVGCGLGSESLYMSLKGANVLGIDIKDERINVALKRKKVIEESLNKKLNCNFKNISVLDLNINKKYDVIWIEQAYHHLEPREIISERISKLLKPNGYIIISESNAYNMLIQLVLFYRRGFNTIKYYEDNKGKKHIYGDERILTAKSLSSTLLKYNIEEFDIEYFRIFPNKDLFNNLFNIENKISKYIIPFFTHYNYIGKKIE